MGRLRSLRSIRKGAPRETVPSSAARAFFSSLRGVSTTSGLRARQSGCRPEENEILPSPAARDEDANHPEVIEGLEEIEGPDRRKAPTDVRNQDYPVEPLNSEAPHDALPLALINQGTSESEKR